MKLREALRVIGMPDTFRVGSQETIQVAMQRCKVLMVQTEGNHEARVKLSQAKEVFKKQRMRYCECGRWKSKSAAHCAECCLLRGKGRWPSRFKKAHKLSQSEGPRVGAPSQHSL